MKDRPCPIWGNMIIDCEKILTGAAAQVEIPCHFYNANSRQCVFFDISDNLQDIPQAITALSFGLRPKKPPRVLFTDVDEYCKEIRADKEEIYRSIVRAALSLTPKENFGNCLNANVVSSYTVADQVISLKFHIGDVSDVPKEEVTKYMNYVLDTIFEKIRTTCIDCLLEFRHGTLVIKM